MPLRFVVTLFALLCSICHADDELKIDIVNGKTVSLRVTGNSANRVEITPDLLEDILSFDDAESLSLFGTTTTDEQLAKLVELKNLVSLDLSYTSITDASATSLAKLEGLHNVRLEGTKITDRTLETLAKLPSVTMLHIAKTEISDRGLKFLRDHKTLNVLELSSCNITNEGLRSIGKPPILQHLFLAKTVRYGEDDKSNLTDDCVDYLLTLDTLMDLDVADSKISEMGLKRLREGLKKCKVSTSSHGMVFIDRKKK